MQNKNTLIKGLIGLIIFGLGLSTLLLWMKGTNPPENERVQTAQPVATLRATYTLSQDVQGVPLPRNEQDGLRLTQVIEKLKLTPISAAEVELQLTQSAARTPWPYGIRPSYPVKSLEDLPDVVYESYPSGDEYMACIGAKNPGKPIFLQSIDSSPDDYMIPFYKNNQLCALAIVNWREDGFARWRMMIPTDHFFFADVAEATALVEQFSGQKVAGTPKLVKQFFNSFMPFWQMTTTDGQVYYVLYGSGMYEEGEYVISISVVQARHLQFSPYIPGAPTATPFPQNPRWPVPPALANYSYPFNSYQDLVQVVYHYPLLESSGPTGDCIRAQHPGGPVMIGDSYYLIPFFQGDQVCAMAITYEKDQKTSYLEAADRVDPIPYGNTTQVIALFEQAFGQKVTGTPILVNAPSPFLPFWKVTAADGQLYYVIFRSILNEDGRFSKTTSIIRAKNWRPAGK